MSYNVLEDQTTGKEKCFDLYPTVLSAHLAPAHSEEILSGFRMFYNEEKWHLLIVCSDKLKL